MRVRMSINTIVPWLVLSEHRGPLYQLGRDCQGTEDEEQGSELVSPKSSVHLGSC